MEYVFDQLRTTESMAKEWGKEWSDWWKLRWKPIKNGTFNLYRVDNVIRRCFSFHVRNSSFSNYGYSFKGFAIEIDLWFWFIGFWVHWNHICVASGPIDIKTPMPLRFYNDGKWHLREILKNWGEQ